MVGTLEKFPGWGIPTKEPMWTFDVNYATQNNSYLQLLATLCAFQPLLRGLRQTSTERFNHCYVIYVKRPQNAT